MSDLDPDYVQDDYVRTKFEPYQQKVFYEAYVDSDENDDESDDDDDLCTLEQPYETITRVGYKESLKHIPTEEVARRSDILVTSTISMSVYPVDRRLISCKYRALMDDDELRNYMDERNSFKALCKEHDYSNPKIRDKDKTYRDNYLRSFINKQQFRSNTL